jgi:hypothetical protein
MNIFYAPYLKLPKCNRMEETMLVSIRRSDQPIKKDTRDFLAREFDEPFGMLVKENVKKKTYLFSL